MHISFDLGVGWGSYCGGMEFVCFVLDQRFTTDSTFFTKDCENKPKRVLLGSSLTAKVSDTGPKYAPHSS